MDMGISAKVFNINWLEENLGLSWPENETLSYERIWNCEKHRLLASLPAHAFLMILRSYMLDDNQLTNSQRLRELIPVLCRLGDSSLTLSAFLLLGIFVMEREQKTDVVSTILEQVSPEMSAKTGSIESVLYAYLLGQIAVKSETFECANHQYACVLDEPFCLYEPQNFLYGRMYQKIGLYLLRVEDNPLTQKWRFRMKEWCLRYPESPITKALSAFEKGEMDDGRVHPLFLWKAAKSGLSNPLLSKHLSTNPQTIQEMDVIEKVAAACIDPTTESLQTAIVTANAYGDPFWIHEAKILETHLEAKRPSEPPRVEVRDRDPQLSFTYFDSFQGYSKANQPLFSPFYNRHKVKQLMGILLLQPRLRIIKDKLALHLFGEDYTDLKGNYLHVTLHRLRQLLRAKTGIDGDWVSIRKDLIVFNENRVDRIDIEEYQKLASVGHELWPSDEEAACELYEKAVKLYQPVVAPEFEYEEWMRETRIHLDHQQRRMLKRLWYSEQQKGKIDEAIRRGEELLSLDPLDLIVLEELCQDWAQAGDTHSMHQVCEKTMETLLDEGEPIPDWLTRILKKTAASTRLMKRSKLRKKTGSRQER